MNPNHCARVLAAMIVLLAAFNATAQDSGNRGVYIGVQTGWSHHAYGSQSDTANGVFGGYQVTRFFAIEASHADLGSSKQTYIIDSCPPGAQCLLPGLTEIRERRTTTRTDIAVVGIWPITSRLDAYARAGFARTRTTSSIVNALPQQDLGHVSDSGADYGVGLRLHVTKPLALRMQYERLNGGASQQSIATVWVGAEFLFGTSR